MSKHAATKESKAKSKEYIREPGIPCEHSSCEHSKYISTPHTHAGRGPPHTQLISRPIAPFIAAVPRPGSALTSPRARTGTQSQTVGAEHARLCARCGEGGGLERRAGGEREIRIRVRPRRVGLVYGGWILRVESGVTDFACTLCTGALGMSATLRAAGI